MITLTPKATAQIRLAAKQSNLESMALRIAVRQVADGTFEYGMGFDQAGDDDVEIVFDGIRMLVYAAQEAFLLGLVIDYDEYLPGKYNFVFINPNSPAMGGNGDNGNEGSLCGDGGCSGCGSRTQGCA